jgi:hypothetical protein
VVSTAFYWDLIVSFISRLRFLFTVQRPVPSSSHFGIRQHVMVVSRHFERNKFLVSTSTVPSTLLCVIAPTTDVLVCGTVYGRSFRHQNTRLPVRRI